MGKRVERQEFTREDRRRYRQKAHRCLDVLGLMLAEGRFDRERPLTGLEIELNLVDSQGLPAMRNAEVLDRIADPAFQTELGRFNIEVNVDPRRLDGDKLDGLEHELRGALDAAEARAREAGSGIVMIGILPTLREGDVGRAALSEDPRYALLDEQILAARGEDIPLEISGPEVLSTLASTIAPEAACTSVQLHQQVRPERFAAHWNAAQVLAGVQLAMGANSPYLLGRELWRETRIPLFTQATDMRSEELKAQGVRPRVWFGERWITSVLDLFEENLRYFPALLPLCDEEDPVAVAEEGRAPKLSELTLHNGTVYRWNRPIYDTVGGVAHLRIENRVLPAGPTVVDVLANGAFYYGCLRSLVEAHRPIWTRMPFRVAEENFLAAARHGMAASFTWPEAGRIAAPDLVLRHLLPLAHAGLESAGVDAGVRDRLLGVIEGRCIARRNGATWQVQQCAHLERSGCDRRTALRLLTQRYAELMHSNLPVHQWPVG
ncbi:glutamate--cysteine ligase family protein [Motilibacter aurantiacus]|uniref:glutamate--cysteine ligase n=1 Tax=Motilibacter aurantiacus TaxID=2714955 RepID=UPI00140AB110|nr:glutamate--cysteine ligase [Motilibacter aurantiacus]NHC47016.1 glutamate--cysteine ligase [Motilibacter aurantiacus]